MNLRITQSYDDLTHDVELVAGKHILRLGARVSLEDAQAIRKEVIDAFLKDFQKLLNTSGARVAQ